MYLIEIFSVETAYDEKDVPANFLDVRIAKVVGEPVHDLIVGEKFAIAHFVKDILRHKRGNSISSVLKPIFHEQTTTYYTTHIFT